ncbi:MAG: hypothetical protein HW414_1545 [Dehalococcoidia bacterium]|nr:hypothetical protein [Dehalococcoidia bacterium]
MLAGEAIIGGQTISYTIKRSPRARYVRLEVKPETGLIVVIPRHYKSDGISDLLSRKQRWILKTLTRCRRVRRVASDKPLSAGGTVSYLGRELEVVPMPSGSENGSGSVSVEGDRLLVCLPSGADGLAAALEGWYRAEAGRMMGEKVSRLGAGLGVAWRRLGIRGQRTRWGSCSRAGGLSFNWKLIMAPEAVVDYVVVHELAHLKEMNHSKMFWQLVERHCPGWREHNRWLKDHAFHLAGLAA